MGWPSAGGPLLSPDPAVASEDTAQPGVPLAAETTLAGREPVTSLELAALPNAVRLARMHTADILHRWRWPGNVDTAQLIVSELLTNAIHHPTPVEQLTYPNPRQVRRVVLTLRLSETLLSIAVWDDDPTPPTVTDADPLDESGRGLSIVAQLSARWSFHHPRHGGKVVWSELPPGDPHEQT